MVYNNVCLFQCLVYIRVENEGRKVYGQNCFPLNSLVPGIKFIPLRTNGGEIIPESGLFVRIRKTEGEETLATIPEEGEGGSDIFLSLRVPPSSRTASTTDIRRSTSPASLVNYKTLSRDEIRPDGGEAEAMENDNEVVVEVDINSY